MASGLHKSKTNNAGTSINCHFTKAVNRTVLTCPGRNNYLSLLENT